MSENIRIIIKADDKEEPIFDWYIPLTLENLNGIIDINSHLEKLKSILPKNDNVFFEKIQEIFKKIREYFSTKPLIDRENAIKDFPPFTEQEIDEALDILEIVKELYKHRC